MSNRENAARAASAIRGSLIGGAVGDALGYAVEFIAWPAIQEKYGKAGIQAYDLHTPTGEAIISDDTQMTLFTLNGLLCHDAAALKSGADEPAERYIWQAYRDWYHCQYAPDVPPDNISWLSGVKAMHAWRAPGNTCLNAIAAGRPGSTVDAVNRSKGCGGIMRVAPAALYYRDPADILKGDRLAAEAAAMTHGHPLGWIPSAAFAHIVGRAAFGGCPYGGLEGIVRESMEAVARLFPGNPYLSAQQALVDQAVMLAHRREVPDAQALHTLGGGWVGDEALADAVFCCLRYPDDFSKAVIAAVNHSGDSDSTGAIVGNIIGAYLGMEAIEPRWLDRLEARDEILRLADDLIDGAAAMDEAHLGRYLVD